MGFINLFLITLPFAIIGGAVKWPPTIVFILNFIAIVPLAKLLGIATEEIAFRTSQSIGGLLNASFGNAVEMI
ncbi:hypothetical protein ROZALSC1DRAFT_14866, partial [Rozella allomycis CSF55]